MKTGFGNGMNEVVFDGDDSQCWSGQPGFLASITRFALPFATSVSLSNELKTYQLDLVPAAIGGKVVN